MKIVVIDNTEKNRYLKLCLLITLLVLAGCAGTGKAPAPDATQMTVMDIRDRIERNYLGISTLQGNGTISAQMPGVNQEASVEVQIIMPDSVSLKVEAIFGIDIGKFISNGRTFALYSPIQKTIYTGALDSLDLSRFFQVNLQYEELMESLVGTPGIAAGQMAPLAVQDNKYLLKIRTSEGVHQYFVDPGKYVITQYKYIDNANQVQIIKNFSRFEKYDNRYLPKLIQIARPMEKQAFSFYYRTRKLNKPIDRKVFKLRARDIPKNTRHIKIGR